MVYEKLSTVESKDGQTFSIDRAPKSLFSGKFASIGCRSLCITSG